MDVTNVPTEQRSPINAGGRLRRLLQKNPRLEWLIPAALCAILLGQMYLSIRQVSETSDESTHIYAGYRYLKCGDVDLSREHPPLARIIAAAPLLPMNLKVDCSAVIGDDSDQAEAAHAWLYSQDDWRAVLFRARTAVSVFTIGLFLLIWIAARRMFGSATAVVATILLIFEPTVLATGALVMTDMPSACTLFFAVFGFYLWARNRTAPFLLLAGLATGLALIAKHSGVLVIPMLCVLAVADAYLQTEDERPSLRIAVKNLLAVGIVCVLAAATVWAAYGMRFSAHSGQPQAQLAQPAAPSSNTGILLAMEKGRLLPQPYLQGFGDAAALTNQVFPVFTLGRIYQQTPWFFVPLNLAIRYTAALLFMIPLAAVGAAMCFEQHRREFLFLLVPISIYLAVCLHASRIGGIRHLLPMLPFLLIVVAAGCVELAKTVRWVSYVLPCLLLLHAASSLHAYPNYLSYANEFWGGPTKIYKYLPTIDWGQGYLQAKDYLARHPGSPCWLLTGWQWDPAIYDLPCQTIGGFAGRRIPAHLHGTVILSSTLLTTTQAEPEQEMASFSMLAPKDSIGGSALLVYEGDFDISAAAGRRAWQSALRSQTIDAALLHSEDAVALAPKSVNSHRVRCFILAKSGQPLAAVAECQDALKIVRDDAGHQAEWQQDHEVEKLEELIRNIRVAYGLPDP
jgi:hypothetical protein